MNIETFTKLLGQVKEHVDKRIFDFDMKLDKLATRVDTSDNSVKTFEKGLELLDTKMESEPVKIPEVKS